MALAQVDELARVRAEFGAAWGAGWKPDPALTVSEWADEYRVLTRETSAEHGRWRTSRTPYAREPMDALSAQSPVRRLVLMWGAQLGKTEIILNWIGYTLHLTPGPMMMVQPTVDVAKNVSKERIVPLVIANPVLAERVLENRSRDGDNTILNKRVQGGFLKLAGANSAAGLRSTPIARLALDEVDAYPADVDGEGDPVALAERRTTNFKRGATAMTSTPTITDHSRIEAEFLKTDQRRYFVPCPHCGHMDWLRRDRMDYRNDDPETTMMLCVACGVLIEERYKTQMLEQGEWRPTAKGDGVTRGYHLSSLYSPLGWLSWAQITREWLEAQKDRSLLRVFVNTRLAETYEDRSDATAEPDSVYARREEYGAEVPDGVGVLVGAVDVQGDRLEYQVKGYGPGEESWLIAWGEISGNPENDEPWHELDELLRQEWTHASGKKLRVSCVTVDSGFKPDRVYRFCKPRAARRVFATKGSNEVEKPLVGRPTRNNSYRTRLYMVCTDTGKETVTARLKIGRRGPGYMHLPSWIDREYVDQLTAEKGLWRGQKGRKARREWVKQRDRNEAFDLEVGSLVALRIFLGPQPRLALAQRAARLSIRPDGSGPPPAGAEPANVQGDTESVSPADLGDTEPVSPKRQVERMSSGQKPWMPGRRRGWVRGWRR